MYVKESMLTYYIYKLLEALTKYLKEHDINRRISKHRFVLIRCVAATYRLNCTLPQNHLHHQQSIPHWYYNSFDSLFHTNRYKKRKVTDGTEWSYIWNRTYYQVMESLPHCPFYVIFYINNIWNIKILPFTTLHTFF